MKSLTLLTGLLLAILLPFATRAADDLSAALQKGLFEEEGNQNLPAAIQAYQSLLSASDDQRRLAATALFRLGECYRKLGQTNDAVAQYQRLLRDYSDQTNLVTLSQQNLAGLSLSSAPPAATARASDAIRAGSVVAAELARTESLLAQLKGWDLSQLRRLIPQLIPDAEFDQLDKELAGFEEAYRRAALAGQGKPSLGTEGDAEFELRRKRLIQRSDELLRILEVRVVNLRAQVAEENARTIQSAAVSTGAGSQFQSGSATRLTLSEEEQEIRRTQALIKDSPDLINAVGSGGQKPLHNAASKGQLRVAEYLMANGADVNAASLYNGAPTGPTPLRAAASSGHKKMVELLLSKGARIEDDGKETALHDAAGKGYKSIVEVLLANKADVNAQDRLGATPLVYAVKNNHLAVARLLLANKAKTEFPAAAYQASPTGVLRDFSGQYPLHIAVRARHEEMVELLLQNGADPNVKVNGATGDDSPSATPLLLAVDYKLKSAMLALLKAKADPAIAAGDARTPLHAAVDSPDLLTLLLESRVDPNITNQFGATALHRAAGNGKRDAAIALIKKGADINATDQLGYTPLHRAAESGNQDMVQLLLTNKANVNARNKGGDTPLELSKRVNSSARYDIAKLLQQHGAVADLPKFDRIIVRRSATGYEDVIFRKAGTNDWNRFTLLELIAVKYGLLTTGAGERGGSAPKFEPMSSDWFFREYKGERLPFPDLARITVRRPKSEDGGWTEIPVDLTRLSRGETADCSGDVPLAWGDVVEIPELEHLAADRWNGFNRATLSMLKQCLSRTVRVTVNGGSNTVQLAPGLEFPPNSNNPLLLPYRRYMLVPVLNESRLLRNTSDLTRVTVTRRPSKAGQMPQRWVLDCSNPSLPPDLWLRDGDEIEVPEK